MQTIDFLPERIRQTRLRRRRLTVQLSLACVAVAALVVLGLVRQTSVQHAQAQCDELSGRKGQMQRLLAVREDLERQQKQLEVLRKIDDDLGGSISTLDLLAELNRLLPANITLTSLELEAVEVKTPIDFGPRKKGVRVKPSMKERSSKRFRLTLTALAPTDVDMANFIGQMSASPLLEDVNMGYARTVDYKGHVAREFQASCYLAK